VRHQEAERVAVTAVTGSGLYAEDLRAGSVPRARIVVRRDGIAKRGLDVAVAGGALIVLFPVFLACMVLAKLQSKGNVFFVGTRIGRGGRPFRMLKFRTMVEDAPSCGPGVTSARDPRVTTVGRVLRRAKLDELPQLLNVLQGSMSMVGPRPELPRYVDAYDASQQRVLSVRPGITGPTQLRFRNEEEILSECEDPETYYVTKLMPEKLASDLAYIRARTFWGDIAWLAKTAALVSMDLVRPPRAAREDGGNSR